MRRYLEKIEDANYQRGYVYNVNYHLIWTTKYRRECFTTTALIEEMKTIIIDIAKGADIQIKEMEIMPEYIHLLVTFKNSNYNLNQNSKINDQVSDQVTSKNIPQSILEFCTTEKNKQEICSFIGYKNLTYFTRKYLNPLLSSGQLKMTIPDKPNSRNQKYITVDNN